MALAPAREHHAGARGLAVPGLQGVIQPARRAVLFSEGDKIHLHAGPEGARMVIVSGKPLREPVAWGGPIVMNTDEELRNAFMELEEGTFIRHG